MSEHAITTAPWTLTGRGHILLLRSSPAADARDGAIPSHYPRQRDHINVVMAVDYEHSEAGPYRELLYIPGNFAFPEGRYRSITRIYVSTMASVVSGRANWGIPKEVADFDWEVDGRDTRIGLRAPDGADIGELAFRSVPLLSVPFTSALLPGRVRTLMQPWEPARLSVTLSARGWCCPARMVRARFDPERFPDLGQRRVIAALSVPRFQMTFPVGRTWPG